MGSIDKHTSIGKEIISKTCKTIDILPVCGLHLVFYLAGAVCNQITNSPFRDLVKEWQLNQMGYTLVEAQQIWNKLKQEIKSMQRVDVEVKDMNRKINTVIKNDSDQLEFF